MAGGSPMPGNWHTNAAMRSTTAHFARTFRVVWQVVRHPVLRRVALAFLAFNAVESGAWIAILLYAYEATVPASVGSGCFSPATCCWD